MKGTPLPPEFLQALVEEGPAILAEKQQMLESEQPVVMREGYRQCAALLASLGRILGGEKKEGRTHPELESFAVQLGAVLGRPVQSEEPLWAGPVARPWLKPVHRALLELERLGDGAFGMPAVAGSQLKGVGGQPAKDPSSKQAKPHDPRGKKPRWGCGLT